jgi:hypothetical protein
LSGVPGSNILIEFRKTQQRTWRKVDPELSGLLVIHLLLKNEQYGERREAYPELAGAFDNNQ